MAIQDFYEQIIIMEKTTISDGMGGFEIGYKDGAEFLGSITTDNSVEMRIAEQQGVKSIYTLTTNKGVPLDYNDIVKRKKDSKTFRITSNKGDIETPSISNLDFLQVTCEAFELPK